MVNNSGTHEAYDEVFEAVIRRAWLAVPDALQNEAGQRKREGRQAQLSFDEPVEWALYDTFNYQRGHADVFREVYRTSHHHPPSKGEHLRVIDIGAGAATVAIALGEACGRGLRERIDYLAFDPHPGMNSLGEQILEHLTADFRSARYVESLEAVEFDDRDRLLFTFSYVSHQEAVRPEDVEQWASLIEQAVARSDRAVELIYTTADNIHSIESRIPMLGRRLEQVGIESRVENVVVRVPYRWPGPVSHDGRVQWEPGHGLWKVQAERWVLRA